MSKHLLFALALTGTLPHIVDETAFKANNTPAYMLAPGSSLVANAGETTTTSLTETIYSEWISPTFQDYAGHYQNPSQFAATYEPDNGSSTVSVPRWVSDMGTPADRGDAVDTEYNGAEATALTANELETDESNFSVSEYAIYREISYNAGEDSISADLLLQIIRDAARILSTAANDDATAKFSGFTNSSGSTGVDLALADLDDGLFDLAERGITSPLVGVLDHQQVRDWAAAIKATSSSQAVYSGAADRIMAASMQPDQGRNLDGLAFSYMNCDFYRSGLTDTANTGADVVGAIFARGDVPGSQSLAALGQASRRPFTVEQDVDIVKRTIKIVASMRWGVGTTLNGSGQKVVTDA